MRIAWFRPTPIGALDTRIATAFETELSRMHVVDAFDERTAHDFVWMHFRQPYDVCLYELGSTARYRFTRAYLFQYAGALLAHDLGEAHDPLLAATLVVVNSASAAELLAVDIAADRIDVAPQFAPAVDVSATQPTSRVIRVGVLDADHRQLASRALARACAADAQATLVDPHDDVDRVVRESDVLIALQGPLFSGPLTAPLLGMSAARPVIVSESDATADWPALDPQTWLRRGYSGNDEPVVVSIDPRDEEHSLMLAIRRLSADAVLRAQLGAAGRRYWEAHATPRHAAEAWRRILERAASAPPPSPNLPPHLTADGTTVAREVLAQFGASVDLFDGDI